MKACSMDLFIHSETDGSITSAVIWIMTITLKNSIW